MKLYIYDESTSISSNSNSDSEDVLPVFETNCFEVNSDSAQLSPVDCPPEVTLLHEHSEGQASNMRNESSAEHEHNEGQAFNVHPNWNESSTEHEASTVHPNESESSGLLQSVLHLNKWISILLIKVKVKYKLSDSVLVTFLSILQLIFSDITPIAILLSKNCSKPFCMCRH